MLASRLQMEQVLISRTVFGVTRVTRVLFHTAWPHVGVQNAHFAARLAEVTFLWGAK